IYLYEGLANAAQTIIVSSGLVYTQAMGLDQNGWLAQVEFTWLGASGGVYNIQSNSVFNFTPGTNYMAEILREASSSDGSSQYQMEVPGGAILGAEEGEDYDVNGPTTPYIDQLVYAVEGLSAFPKSLSSADVTSQSDYPAGYAMRMFDIDLQTGSSPAVMSWTPSYNGLNALWGEHATVVSNNTTGLGEVDLWYTVQPNSPLINAGGNFSTVAPTTGTPWLITGVGGHTVTVTLSSKSIGSPQTRPRTTAIVTLTTPGATFSDGSTSMSVTEGDVAKTVVLPGNSQLSGTVSSSKSSNTGTGLVTITVN
ncbi:MAG TPA: hypothetical protein VL547_13590, partial [Dinghuibacter sp.]|uniref:hypothetical protein n=1 Tax=Dinghuibacter sp. TaxID=2024697 RepID=UPI002CD6B459